mmetsp:Transcript_11082/g.33683  ORF Transcript_11082/g.33683 Transcript_11082/m.33683 type:complete len:552 (-) Transcript_11082:106-1761(-)
MNALNTRVSTLERLASYGGSIDTGLVSIALPEQPLRVCAYGMEGQAQVWWNLPEDVDPPVSFVLVKRWRRDERSEGEEWVYKGTTKIKVGNSAKITDLPNGSYYKFKICLENENGRGPESGFSNEVRIDVPLPEDWQEFKDPASGKYFYRNQKTGATTWVRPEDDPMYVPTELFLNFSEDEFTTIARLFKECDFDESGGISFPELQELLVRVGEMMDSLVLRRICLDVVRPAGNAKEKRRMSMDNTVDFGFLEYVKVLAAVKHWRETNFTIGERIGNFFKRQWHKATHSFADAVCHGLSAVALGRNKRITPDQTDFGAWEKKLHPVLDQWYFENKETGHSQWHMPDEIKFHLSDKQFKNLRKNYEPAEIEHFKESFQQIDIDDSGTLDEVELKVLMEASMGVSITRGQAHGLMQEVDYDHSGSIDFAEFCALMIRVKKGKTSARWENAAKAMKEGTITSSIREAKFAQLMSQKTIRKKGALPEVHFRSCLCGCRRAYLDEKARRKHEKKHGRRKLQDEEALDMERIRSESIAMVAEHRKHEPIKPGSPSNR